MSLDDEKHESAAVAGPQYAGYYLTVREAYEIFVTKSALGLLLQQIQNKLDQTPSRPELEGRWKVEDERYERLEAVIMKQDKILDEIRANRLPKWLLPAIGVLSPFIAAAAGWVALHWK